MMKKMFVIGMMFAAVAAQAGEIHSFVSKKLKEDAKASLMVMMKSQVDFSGMNLTKMTREDRVTAVYQALVKNANDTQSKLIQYLEANHASYRRYFISNAILVENATAKMVQEISKMSEVNQILGNPQVRLTLPKTEASVFPLFRKSIEESIASIGTERVWKELGITGKNIVIAGQDTGYQWDHPALKDHYRGWDGKKASHDYNWHDSIHKPVPGNSSTSSCGYALSAPCDDNDHGTHTMGTMVGAESNGDNQIGMAPGAKWIGCRNMDAGMGSPATYLECFQFFLAPTAVNGDPFKAGRPELAPHVINNSWGCDGEEGCTGDEILPALKAMKAAGIVVVASAGNEGPGCSTIQDPPAYHTEYVLSVGAINHRNGKVASFSSRGPSTFDKGVGPDVMAPGVNIRSSVPGSDYKWLNWSGTSMAGPHVVGQVALMLSAQPKLIGNVDQVLSVIRTTAENTTSSETCGGVPGGKIPNNTYGYGKTRVFESVKAAMSL